MEAREERRRQGKGWGKTEISREEKDYMSCKRNFDFFFQAFFLALVSVKSGFMNIWVRKFAPVKPYN